MTLQQVVQVKDTDPVSAKRITACLADPDRYVPNSSVKFVNFEDVREGTEVCCPEETILMDGNWSSWPGKESTFYTRTSRRCMKPYEGTDRSQQANVQLVCLSVQ